MRRVLKLTAALCFIFLLAVDANALGSCGSCDVILNPKPAFIQKQGKEIYQQFLTKSDEELAILIASQDKICEVLSCGDLEPGMVKSLVGLVQDSKRNSIAKDQIDRQFWIGIANSAFAFAALIISIVSLKRNRK